MSPKGASPMAMAGMAGQGGAPDGKGASPLGTAGADAFRAFTPQAERFERKQWMDTTSGRRELARQLAGDMRRRLQKYEQNEQASKALELDFVEAERQRAKDRAMGRIEAHRHAVDESASLITRIGAAVNKLDDVSIKLKKERYERCTQLQVCQRRLELRDKRPVPERVKDCLTVELEKEQAALLQIRAELMRRETGVRQQRQRLADLRTELSADTGSRRLQVAHETHYLKPTVLPSMKPKEDKDSEQKKALDDAKRREVLTKMANKLLGGVNSFCESSFEALQASQSSAAEMLETITLTFAKRADELAVVKQGVEEDLTALSQTIDKAEADLDKYTRRLDPADKEKGAIIAANKQLLKQLKATKEDLVEDLHNKIKAKDCDDACLRVRPMNAFDLKASQAMATELAAAKGTGKGHGSATNFRTSFGGNMTGGLSQSVSSPTLVKSAA
eukprot:TRINITY_DN7284_c0_g1_i1.p1 TRINITY_DN7284_c0_g1~~TRINITY_DN7284_c0_g1_i1.p1  ORF type:complete len:448 (+),score=168.17 TRINITY_DN7284_c0_g1_i1:114-1457(+)